jgi:hypothetical protein
MPDTCGLRAIKLTVPEVGACRYADKTIGVSNQLALVRARPTATTVSAGAPRCSAWDEHRLGSGALLGVRLDGSLALGG